MQGWHGEPNRAPHGDGRVRYGLLQAARSRASARRNVSLPGKRGLPSKGFVFVNGFDLTHALTSRGNVRTRIVVHYYSTNEGLMLFNRMLRMYFVTLPCIQYMLP